MHLYDFPLLINVCKRYEQKINRNWTLPTPSQGHTYIHTQIQCVHACRENLNLTTLSFFMAQPSRIQQNVSEFTLV